MNHAKRLDPMATSTVCLIKGDQSQHHKEKSLASEETRLFIFGAPGAIRTPDPLVRSQILYPTELRAPRFAAMQQRQHYNTILSFVAVSEGFEPSIQV